jgi:signal transduction histidine kinase
LADELKGAVAAADHLMRRVQMGAKRTSLKAWRGDVKDYARATLKAEALAVELEEEVGRTNGLVKALDDLSSDAPTPEIDVSALLAQFADFLRDGLPEGAALRVDAPRACHVAIPRSTVVGMLSNAIDSALYNMLEADSTGRILLRASTPDSKTVVVEVSDDGAPAAPLLHASAKDPSFSDSRSERLRHLRKRARRAGGEVTLKSDASGNVLSLYLPAAVETAAYAQSQGNARTHSRRRRRVGPPLSSD